MCKFAHRHLCERSGFFSLRSKCSGFPKPDFSAANCVVSLPFISPNIWGFSAALGLPLRSPSSASSAWPMATRSDGCNGISILPCASYRFLIHAMLIGKFLCGVCRLDNLSALHMLICPSATLRLLRPVIPAPKQQGKLIGFGRSASTPGQKKPSGLGWAGPSAQSCADGIHQ